MSDENKKLKFKTITQEIKFRGESNYKTTSKIEIEEHIIPTNDLDREISSKISLTNDTSENKFPLSEDNTKSFSLDEHIDKILLTHGSDNQSLSNNDVTNIQKNEEKKDSKSINLPLLKRKKYSPKEEQKNKLEETKIDYDYSKPINTSLKTNSNSTNELNNNENNAKLTENEITRHSFNKANNNDSKSTNWGKSSFGKKKRTPKKSEQTLEEEANGIYRTSTLKKPKQKTKEIIDDDGLIRSSSKPIKQYTNKGKKEYVYNEEKLYNYGINRLSEQNYGRHELFKKMKNLQEDETIINKVLDKLENQKYLSDSNRIRSFLMSYSNSESVNKTKQRLIQKGFNKKDIETILLEMEESDVYKAIQDKESEEDKAIALLIRRFRIYESEKQDKMTRFLASKGFNFDIISTIMKKFSNGDFDTYDLYN